MADGIFSRLRIADASMGWAGPMATMLFGDLGAQIIKVEACRRPDWWRGGVGPVEQKDKKAWERSPNFNSVNRNKYGIALDLTTPEGAAVFKKLVSISDIVIENYTPRVMGNLGLSYDILKEINPKLIMISLPAFGNSGPWRDYTGFGMTTESMSGMPALCGYEDGPPILQCMAYGDPMSGLNGAIALLIALRHREVTGKGQYIDLSQVEALTPHIGAPLMDHVMNQRVQPRRGNRNLSMAPHGVYRCKGDDRWVAIAVTSDEEWQRLCEAIGSPELAKDSRFTTLLDRLSCQDELDAIIEAWTRDKDNYEVMRLLQEAGVPAGPVATPPDLLLDRHLKDRGFFQIIDRALVGAHPHPGVTIKWSKTPGTIRKPTPLLGEDNEFVLSQILHLSEEEIDELRRKQVIGKEPIW